MVKTAVGTQGEPGPYEKLGQVFVTTAEVDPDSLSLVVMTLVAEEDGGIPPDDPELDPAKMASLREALKSGQTVTGVLLSQVVEVRIRQDGDGPDLHVAVEKP